MKLVVPYAHALLASDARLIRLAEFLGVDATSMALPEGFADYQEFLDPVFAEDAVCLAVNPSVLEKWIGSERFPSGLAAYLTAKCRSLLVYGVRPQTFDASLVAALSGGWLEGVEEIGEQDRSYEVLPASKDVCEAFAGLTFGPTVRTNDRVFGIGGGDGSRPARTLISIAGKPFMASAVRGACTVFFVGSEDVADLSVEVEDDGVSRYFSRFLPYAMALRQAFGEECWRPSGQYACVIVDDPLLKPRYGFLHFDVLLDLAKKHNFHTTIAFIPHNFRRNSARVVAMFHQNPERLSLCFHGNDHTGGEFATGDEALLHTMLEIAGKRMARHHELTGLDCAPVMVFPQGKFSREAMSVLKSRNFDCAVNTDAYPMGQPAKMTLGELSEPAVLRYGQFPLFLRRDSDRTQKAEIAHDLFFGRPVLIVEHHDVFQHPERLIKAVSAINEVGPEICWTDVGRAVRNSVLWRQSEKGDLQIRAYAREVEIRNQSNSAQRVRVDWKQTGNETPVDRVLKDGAPCKGVALSDSGKIGLSSELNSQSSTKFAVVYKNEGTMLPEFGFRRTARGFVRRRLSEVRDNYLSKNSPILSVAQALQRRFLS